VGDREWEIERRGITKSAGEQEVEDKKRKERRGL